MTEAKTRDTSRFDQLFSTTEEHAVGGVVFLIEGKRGSDDEISVTLAHTGGHNFDYNESVSRLSSPYQTLIDQNQLGTEKMREILHTAFAETIVKDWKGITLKGKPCKFSRDKVAAVFEESPSFFDACQKFSRQANNYRAEYVNGAVGNSPSSSDGT